MTSVAGSIIVLVFLIFISLQKKSLNEPEKELEKKPKKKNLVDEINHCPIDNIQLVQDFLKKAGWRYWLSEDNQTFRLRFNVGDRESYELFINLQEHFIEFYCIVMEELPDESVLSTIEIVARLNQFFNCGNLKFYFENRMVVYSNSLILFDNVLTEEKLDLFLDATFTNAKMCRPILNKVVKEGEEPFIAAMDLK